MEVNRQSAIGNRHLLAWCGWRLDVPDDWHPLKIEGTWQKGSMMVGTDDGPIVLVKWWRPGKAGLDGATWLTRRFKALRALPDPDAPHPAGFDTVGWLRHLERKDGAAKTVWYGYSQRSGLVLECISTTDVAPEQRDLFFSELLPGLRVAASNEPVPWSVFSASFTSPRGYRLVKHHLVLGDIALDLQDDAGHRLVLRQVFPATLATQRRKLAGWLARSPFLDRRELYRPEMMSGGGQVHEQGWKRLPWPMGWLKPRYCDRVASVANDRILIAESQTRRQETDGAATRAVASMIAPGAQGRRP